MHYAMTQERWTPGEDDWLRANYPAAPIDFMVARLKRSPDAIKSRAHVLRTVRAKSASPTWEPSGQFVQDVQRLYPTVRAVEIARRSNVSVKHVYIIARQLSLRKLSRRQPLLVSRIRQLGRTLTYKEIAIACEVSRGCVAGVLRDYGRAP